MNTSVLSIPRRIWPALAAHALPAALTAAALYLSVQRSDDAVCLLINLGLFAVPALLVAALSGRLSFAIAVASLLSVLLWTVGEFKKIYFDNRLALLDFTFLSEPANWSIVLRYPRLEWAAAGFLLACVLMAIWAWWARRGSALGWTARGVCLLLLAGWSTFAWQNRHYHSWEVFRDDADCGLLKTCGVMSRLVYSYAIFEVPDALPSGDPTLFASRAQQLQPVPAALPGARPDVVVWLNESTFDPRDYQVPGAKWPRLKMFDKLPETRARGLLRVHTFGGKTWLSEFSLLTGLVPDDFGARRTTVFNAVAPHVQDNLPQRFRASGYRAIVLMPTMKRFYGAARTYEAMGFEQVLTLRDFPEYDNIPGDEWDIAESDRLAEAAVTLLKRNAQASAGEHRPLFLYMLSIHEHAPYSKKTKPLPGLVKTGLKPSLAAKLSDYQAKLAKLDRGIGMLEAWMSQQSHRTLWAYFGDHQAYFEEPQPPYAYALPQPDYVTQYQIRANFRPLNPVDAPGFLDIALLPSLIADYAGLERDTYFDGLSAMRRLCEGRLEDCADSALKDSFKGWVYRPQLALLGH
ncbi:Phosphoglycerol transferase MdoB [Solimonas aquatica]|uniref:Phosphoglycerol transferase MdoB n=1 Tax=Solimonas aquatica TaxID=489703 RepID=A0A1H9GS06_9GAMM|nr:sulfatase-like hydrolase/transferase [Solimonas aquatica]SEQ52844.1 Phosphoglycerol transferase MdoB [Solimonas aquatica]